jgi:hypothetical protein
MKLQGHQLTEVDDMAMRNLDPAGLRFKKQTSLFKSPGTMIRKGQYS